MAAIISQQGVFVRAAEPGEGRAIAGLWRELWEAHEGWGGYAASRDADVYAHLGDRLDDDATMRGGFPVMGRHAHLIATANGRVAGQVEGWFERQGVQPSTPPTCEVRSLIVSADARNLGVGRALLDALARTALDLARGAAVTLAAEVLEPNPAQAFYARVGYRAVAHSARIFTHAMGAPTAEYKARAAQPSDALALALLDSTLAIRRRRAGDTRFDRPRAVDASGIAAIAAHLSNVGRRHGDPSEVVVVDAAGDVRASATLAIGNLDPPFLPAKRAMLGRFALDPALAPALLVPALLAFAGKIASTRGALTIELTDLSAPGTPLHNAMLAAGAKPWSRVVLRHVGPRLTAHSPEST